MFTKFEPLWVWCKRTESRTLRRAINQFLSDFHIYCPIFVKFVCRLSRNSRTLNLLEPQGPVQACNGIPLLPFVWYICCTRRFGSWLYLSLQHICWHYTDRFIVSLPCWHLDIFVCILRLPFVSHQECDKPYRKLLAKSVSAFIKHFMARAEVLLYCGERVHCLRPSGCMQHHEFYILPTEGIYVSVWFLEETVIISQYNSNLSVFITNGVCSLRGTNRLLKYVSSSS
jgi:hypothetical protein